MWKVLVLWCCVWKNGVSRLQNFQLFETIVLRNENAVKREWKRFGFKCEPELFFHFVDCLNGQKMESERIVLSRENTSLYL